MCLEVYVGSDKPFCLGPPEMDGAVAPASVEERPAALADCLHEARLAQWREKMPNCSCVFVESSLPWEPEDEDPETVAAFDVLRALAQEHGAALRILGCEYGDEQLAPNVVVRLAPEHIRAGMILFNIPFQGGELPRILVEIVPGLARPEKPESLGVL